MANKYIVLYVVLCMIVVAAAIYINYVIANKFRKVAIDKGHDAGELHVFAMCFWLGIIGYLYVIALPDRRYNNSHKGNE